MAIDVDRSFEVENGIQIEDGPFYTGGANSPVGLDLPTKTIYTQNTSSGVKIWLKFNTGTGDWRQLSAVDIPFNDASTPIIASELQTAIEEAQDKANAVTIQGFSVDATAPTNKQILHYTTAEGVHWHDGSSVGSGRNSVALFLSDINGQNVNTGTYKAIVFKPVAGANIYSQSPVSYTWGVTGASSSGGTMDIRLVKKSDASVIGTLSWDNETDPVFKSLDVTANIPSGINLLQIEGKRTSGTGVLYSSGLEVVYG